MALNSIILARTIAIAACTICLMSCDQAPIVAGKIAPRGKFTGHCAAALTKATRLTPLLDGAELALPDPHVLKAGDTPRIQCAIVNRRGQVGAVTADVICGAGTDPSCVNVVSAVSNGRVLLAPKRN